MLVADLIGPEFGGLVAELLANTPVIASIATILGTSLTDFLAYPGSSTALTDALGVFATAVLDGTPFSGALSTALTSLQADRAYQAAVGVVIPNAVNAIAYPPDNRRALGQAAAGTVVNLLGITNPFLRALVGQVTNGAVLSLLRNIEARDLIGRLGVAFVSGTPTGGLADIAIEAVLSRPLLQSALGIAIGQGIGALFGDNIIGAVVAGVVGVGASVAIAIAIGIINIVRSFNGFSVPTAAAAVFSTAADDDFFSRVPAEGDYYLMRAVMQDRRDVAALRRAATGDSGFVLTQAVVTGEFFDVTMATPGNRGPRFVARFLLRDIPATASGAARGREAGDREFQGAALGIV